MTFPALLLSDHMANLADRRAAADPHGPAVSDDNTELDNQEFLRRVLQASEYLRVHGARPGDVVALQLPNGVDFVVLLFAAWRIGCTVTPVNPALLPDETQYQLTDSGAVLLVDLHGEARFEGATTIAATAMVSADGGRLDEPVTDHEAMALLIYTSGTTGRPKGVILTHANLIAMASMGAEGLRASRTDRSLLILPLFHVNGIVVSVLVPLLVGGSTVIGGRFDPATFFDLVDRVRPTYFSGVPTIFALLAQLPEECEPDASSIRFAACGAAPAPAGLLEAFERRFGFPVLEGYGLSEGTCASTINPADGTRKPGTVGLPLPGQRIKIVDADGSEVGQGVTGQVAISGANIMLGYLGRPEETRAALVDGWLMTGDLGHLDSDGYLTIDGRVKDMIIRGGENIYPREIEDVLATHPSTVNVAVVGQPDQMWGEVVTAFVTVNTGDVPTSVEADLHAWCAQRLTPYKRPVSIAVLSELPLNAMGKIDKLALRSTAKRPPTSPRST
ncbi:class I adenylate-forming enzyme family protein [Aeromicrobium sp.]|uniref:class I adenylate-forming enzyme family protein n=1 Tax=Aeromicrobium sp. TaxID=1871063 RepID=UPI002FC5EFCF